MPTQKENGKINRWILVLYIVGGQAKSMAAHANIKRICEEHLTDGYSLEVVDITEAPEAAVSEQILAVPTLIRRSPEPSRRIIGDLGDAETVLISLGVQRANVSAAQ